jgi:hypothetical protein
VAKVKEWAHRRIGEIGEWAYRRIGMSEAKTGRAKNSARRTYRFVIG